VADRLGMSIEVVSVDQVQEMLHFYQELTEMWAVEDAAHV